MNNNQPVKQLNNFAKVIQVDANGQPIQKEEIKLVEKTKNKPVKIEHKLVPKEANPMITFYIIIILILIAILTAFIVYYVLPRIM